MEDTDVSPDEVLHAAHSKINELVSMKQLQSSASQQPSPPIPQPQVTWTLPFHPFIKINVDNAHNCTASGMGIMLRDHRSVLLLATSIHSHLVDLELVEALAFQADLSMARDLQLSHVHLEGDVQKFVLILLDVNLDIPWRLHNA
uniref:RNase H type-1 domain-containing protein n=1 Tax=Nelumbo nucifera TaxID=4432 RepID=A0A822Y1J5_NELNU|nr:TPA_asm: hypothetical protein HUJ06_026633 [Nelumbo nucifera]